MPSTGIARPVRVGYGLGSFCTGTFATVPGLLLLYYLTNVLGVRAVIAGLAVFVPKAWDLIINPVVGRLSDRTQSRYGPRRPWLLAGAVTLPLCFALTFSGPPLDGAAAGLFVGVAFLLASAAFALFEVPYTAAETVVFALGALVLAGILAATGFVSSDLNHPVAQPPSAL